MADSPPKYMPVSRAINPLVAIGSLSSRDIMPTPYAVEEPVAENPEHSRNTGKDGIEIRF